MKRQHQAELIVAMLDLVALAAGYDYYSIRFVVME
jgi:hypothetical protein